MDDQQQNIISKLMRELVAAREEAQKAMQERDKAIEQLKEREEKAAKAEKASKMKSLFLANMSHEIRTPLNAVEGFSRIMAETDSAEERMKFLEIIESNNNRRQTLINEVLDLSRVEAGEITIRKKETDLENLCRNIKLSFKFRCSDQVKLICEKPTETVFMMTDQNRIMQVFSNLIGNALKHTPSGSITFGYRLSDTNDRIFFYVKDTGSGIAPDDLHKIFFTYVSKDAADQKGHGLGLSLSKIIVEKMGGHISVESELGKGSCFTFEFPFEGTVCEKSQRTREAQNSRTLRVTLRPTNSKHMKTILVAEDEESNFQLVKNILGKKYRLVRALNGIEAVTLNDDEHPDLILMDIRMPQMNGLDATRIIKEVNHDTPIIALSAFAFDENINEAMSAGCNEFMAKPFRVEELVEKVEKYLNKKKQ